MFQYMDRDTDDVLSDLPLELTLSNIREQVKYPQTTIDYLQTLKEKMDLLRETLEDEEGDMEPEVENQYTDYRYRVASDVLEIISENYDVSIDVEFLTADEAWELAEAAYHFFVVDYLENSQRFCWRYIKKYKEGLASGFLDVEATRSKKKSPIKGQELQIIAANIADVMDTILTTDIDEREFIELAAESDSNDASVLLGFLETGSLFGNFADKMIGRLNEDFSFVKANIIMALTTKLNKKIEKKGLNADGNEQ